MIYSIPRKDNIMGYKNQISGMNKNWKFHLGDSPEAFQKDYDDSQWREVTLPHDWSVEGEFSIKYSSGTGYLQGGTGWYRKSFALPESAKGKKVWLVFDGIYKNSKVWCNGYYLGMRPSGYTSFQYDITHAVCFGDQENEISVRVEHEDISDSRWFTGSGMTRKVSCIIQEKLHFEEYGVFMTAKLAGDAAGITVANEVKNDSCDEITFEVNNILQDNQGKEVLRLSSSHTLKAGRKERIINNGNLASPKLWSNKTPYLYTLSTFIEIEGNAVNEMTEKVGIRNFVFDPNEGFFINGENEILKGVCVHHDAGVLGAAVHPNVWRRRLLKLKDMGCNAIRMSHNPHTPELYSLCDELGFYAIDEAFDEWEGCKNKWSTGHNVYPPKHQGYYEAFPQWHDADLRALVRRDRNHPSVLMWSIGNEIDYPNDPYCHPMFQTMTGNNDKNKPMTERMYNPNKPNMDRLVTIAKELARIAKEEDDSRPVTLAAAFPELSAQIGFIDAIDVAGYNYKEQFYKRDHETFPDKPFLGSENGHSMEAWRAVTENKFISGQFLWTGIDFLGETSGWPHHGSEAGHLTVAGYEKLDYWFRQALWSEKPVANIVTARKADIDGGDDRSFWEFDRNWTYVPGEEIIVRCFTGEDSAQLFINGESIGVQEVPKDLGYAQWEAVYKPGTLSAAAGSADDKIETSGSAVQICAKAVETKLKADGEDVAQIEVTLLDDSGNPVIGAENKISVSVNGNAGLLGIESGNLRDNTAYSSTYRNAYRGQLIVYIRSKDSAGSAEIDISGEFLKPAHISIPVV